MRIFLLLMWIAASAFAVEIQIDAAAQKPISPYIYGKNNSLSDDPGKPLTAAKWQLLRDAGIRIFRDVGGNNSTKYNWRRRLSSHPNWYNNVYAHDWDYAAKSLQQNLPDAKGLWTLQVLGYTADNHDHNFNDWGYNQSQWWDGVNNNWAGGGGPDRGNGDTELYLVEWPADSTVAIFDHWFSDLGLNSENFEYWNMDNEPEVWNYTHDDVISATISAEEYLQRYFAVAKAARVKFPQIKLVGPVATNEWQWYNWNNDKISSGGKSYVWLEYFIKRVAEEQAASGVRLLDVLDFHFYPYETNTADIVQLHRVWFDKTYNYPGANGVKRAGSGGWDGSITKEYVFERCRVWLEKYLGANHGVGFGITEMGIQGSDPNVTAVWHASTLGVFADNGVELFTPWDWKIGMYEVVHLFSRYAQELRVASTSDQETVVSAYSSMNAAADSLTIILVNRSLKESSAANVRLTNFQAEDGNFPTLTLDDLPATETFKSQSNNALKSGTVTVSGGSFSLTLPALSITAVLLTGQGILSAVEQAPENYALALRAYPNPFNPVTQLEVTLPQAGEISVDVFDLLGRHVASIASGFKEAGRHTYTLNADHLPSGMYWARLSTPMEQRLQKIVLMR